MAEACSTSAPSLTLPALQRGFRRLYLCRHGQTDWNLQNRIQGCNGNRPLNATGHQQAKLLGKLFSEIPLDIVASSTLDRSRETADVIAAMQLARPNVGTLESVAQILEEPNAVAETSMTADLHASPTTAKSGHVPTRIVLPEFQEMCFGEFEGQLFEDISEPYTEVLTAWRAGDVDRKFPGTGGENLGLVAARGVAGLAKLGIAISERPSDESSAATTNDRDYPQQIAIVAHGRFNKILICHLLGTDLSLHNELHQGNCCVNVFDFDSSCKFTKVILNYTQHVDAC